MEDLTIGARVAFGAVAGTDRKAWTWSGEGKAVSHNLPLKFIKFATSEGALTTFFSPTSRNPQVSISQAPLLKEILKKGVLLKKTI